MNSVAFLAALVCVAVALPVSQYGGNSDELFQFSSEGTFKILQLTDLHYGEDDEVDLKTDEVVKTVIKSEKPDLVVITGDAISGFAWDGSSGWFEKKWIQITQNFVELNQRYAYVLGNHDDQADLNRAQIVKLDQSLHPRLSSTHMGPDTLHGATNYILPVMSSRNSSSVATNLFFFDSNDDDCEEVEGWGCVYPDQVEWYREQSLTSRKRNNGVVPPGLAFFHIPMPEFMEMYNSYAHFGSKDEAVCCFSVNTGLYAAMKEMADIRAVFCGHDHNNDFLGEFNNITLAYGRKSGYGCYGPPKGWLRGARVISLQEAPFTMESWIRQEDGSRMDQTAPQPPPSTAESGRQDVCCDALGGTPGKCRVYEKAFRVGNRMAEL